MNCTPENEIPRSPGVPAAAFPLSQLLLNQLLAHSAAAKWSLSPHSCAAALQRSATKHFALQSSPPAGLLEEYFRSLHVRDLALACACADGCSAAWDYFVSAFRPYLRSAAAAVLRCPSESPAARDLADSLFADLYGLANTPDRRSLFRYFHGRSSLQTWLRAVLAQRHVDAVRASRRFTEIEPPDGHAAASASAVSLPPLSATAASPADPHRSELAAHFRRTLEIAMALLHPRDKERLRLYYSAGQTLAEIGGQLSEHESTVSRHLELTRRELRQQVEHHLRHSIDLIDINGAPAPARLSNAQTGLSDAQIALCFQYAAEDAPIDLDQLLPETPAATIQPARKKP